MRVGLLNEEAVGGHRSKHPQPVLDPLPSDLYEGSIADATRPDSEPHAEPYIQTINGHAAADVAPLQDIAHRVSRTNGPRDASPHLPMLLRAKSDFGPFNERQRSADDAARGHGRQASIPLLTEEAKIRMRHGWEAQLQSDEQANLLSQVRQHHL